MSEQHNTPDAWEPGSDKDVHVTSIVFIGIIGAVLTIVIVLALKALYYETLNRELAKKQGKGVDIALSDLHSDQLLQLNEYRWVDPRSGKVGLPIQDAMKIVVAEAAGKPHAGIEITDWDHRASDINPTPGNLVLLGQGLSGALLPSVQLPPPAPPIETDHPLGSAGPDEHKDPHGEDAAAQDAAEQEMVEVDTGVGH
jgi:hypothetical protein